MHRTSPLSDPWPEVLAQLPASLDLEATARDCGALRRCRAIRSGRDLLRLGLIYGPGGASLRGAAAWAAQSGVGHLSDVAVLKRLRGASAWLEHIAGALVSARLGDAPIQRPLRLADGTVITGPGGADWRLHAIFDPVTRCFTHLELTGVTGAETLTRGPILPGEIRIGDRNYARRADMHRLLSGDADFILRTGWSRARLRQRDGRDFDLFAALEQVGEDDPADIDLSVVGRRGEPDVPVRLIVLCKPEDLAERERLRISRRASKKGTRTNAKTLTAAKYTLFLTSLPRPEYDAEKVAALYRLRWQIELAFKRLKSIVRIDRLPARDPKLARSWIAAHLIVALLTEDMAGAFPDTSP